jgi:hypothetical protein
MEARGGGYGLGVQLANADGGAFRRLGLAHVRRGPRTLRLRVFVRGAGYSNMVLVRVSR